MMNDDEWIKWLQIQRHHTLENGDPQTSEYYGRKIAEARVKETDRQALQDSEE